MHVQAITDTLLLTATVKKGAGLTLAKNMNELEVFVDYVCPYCLLVEPALQELKLTRNVKVRIRPFELRPNPVPTLRPEDDYLPRVWRQSVYPMARKVGIEIKLSDISPQPRTEKAFLVMQLAEEAGVGEDYSAAVFRAFFQDNRDIEDDDVLVDICKQRWAEWNRYTECST